MTSAASNHPTDPPPAAAPRRAADFGGLRPGAKRCLTCGREPAEGESMTAVLIELPRPPGAAGDADFQRLDYCADCWKQAPWAAGEVLLDEGQSAHPADDYGAAPVAIWTARACPPPKPKRTFVDDTVLTKFFLRLADDPQPERQRFRFVLMLILMRHRKLRHEGTERAPADSTGAAGGDTWRVRVTPAMAQATGTPPDEIHRVCDPRLDETQVQQVARQLSQILHEDIDADEEGEPA